MRTNRPSRLHCSHTLADGPSSWCMHFCTVARDPRPLHPVNTTFLHPTGPSTGHLPFCNPAHFPVPRTCCSVRSAPSSAPCSPAAIRMITPRLVCTRAASQMLDARACGEQEQQRQRFTAFLLPAQGRSHYVHVRVAATHAARTSTAVATVGG